MTLGVVCRAVFAAAFLLLSSTVPVQAQEQPAAIDRCVPADLRGDLISFQAEDDVEIRGLLLGSGARGVLLAGTLAEKDPCGWLPLARELAADGYLVLLSDVRGLIRGDRKKNFRYDLDLEAGARELDRRGASEIVAASSTTGATVVAASAGKLAGLTGIVLLSPLKAVKVGEGGRVDAVAGLEKVNVPVFVVAAEDDQAVDDEGAGFVAVEHARALGEAASGSRVEIVPGEANGTELIADGERMRGEVRAFVKNVMPPVAASPGWLVPVAAGVVVLALVVAVLIVRRRRSRAQDDGAGAVGGHEAG